MSISTVSRVLNNAPGVSDQARDAVLAAVNRTGYVPEVGRRSASNVALVYTAGASLDSPFDAALVNGVYAGLDGAEADLLILDARRSRQPGESLTQMLVRKGAAGALLRVTTASQGLCEEVAAEGFAAVVVGSRPDEPRLHCIYSDSRPARQDAVGHLLALGHRRIAFGAHVVDDSDHADRLAGYRDALEVAGVPADEALVVRAPFDRAGGVQVVRRVAAMSPRPTAVVLADPLMAVGALAEARRLGLRVPEDLSVVGFDDGELRHALVPRLTAVCQDTVGLGKAAAAQLLEVIARKHKKPRREARR
ncbi:MAG: LacI family DNA-binding transcriptional regulator, partial [Gemmataceae bacterium]